MDQRLGGEGQDDLVRAVTRMYLAVNGVGLPEKAPGLDDLRAEHQRALRLLESYTLPRLEQKLEAPLVVVIGGPTGAGKSTLVNSLVGAQVTASGVLRPTTRQPVMVYNQADAPALRALGLLRAEHEAATADASRWVQVRAVPSPDVVPGLTLIDSPDLDSRVDGNRTLAAQLLDLADLWLFVTTGTDYADVLSWGLLTEAARRRTAVAVLLNRLREREAGQVRRHFATLLTQSGLARAHVFTLPELSLVEGRMPVQFVLPLQGWLEKRAVRDEARTVQMASTFEGSVDQAVASVRALAGAAADQVVAARRLRVDLEAVFSTAREQVRWRCADSSLVGEDLAAAWRAVDPGLAPAHAARGSAGARFRRRGRGDQQDAVSAVSQALRSSVGALMREQVDLALFRVSDRLTSHAAISSQEATTLAALPADFEARVDGVVHDWLRSVQDRVRSADPRPRRDTTAPHLNGATLALATLAVEGRPARGSDTAEGPGTLSEHDRLEVHASVHQWLLHLSGDAIPAMAREAWLDLISALNEVILAEEARLSDLIDEGPVLPEAVETLRAAADDVERARRSAEATVSR